MARDTIALEGMVFYGHHGVSPEEKALGQRFIVDLELSIDLSKAGRSDDLRDTVDYSEVYRLVKEIVEGLPRNLLESLAEEIGARVLSRYPVEKVRVRVKKPEAPIKGSVLSWAAVEIVRGKSQRDTR